MAAGSTNGQGAIWRKGPAIAILSIGVALFLLVTLLIPLGHILSSAFWDQDGFTLIWFKRIFSAESDTGSGPKCSSQPRSASARPFARLVAGRGAALLQRHTEEAQSLLGRSVLVRDG